MNEQRDEESHGKPDPDVVREPKPTRSRKEIVLKVVKTHVARKPSRFAEFGKLISSISWPLTTLVIFTLLYFSNIGPAIAKWFEGNRPTELEAKIGEYVNFRMKMVESGLRNQPAIAVPTMQLTANAVSESAATGTLSDSVSTPPSQVEELAQSGVARITAIATRKVWPVASILWVDPHPANNIGLQFAFQSLGLLVVCIQDDSGLEGAFRAAGGKFDVVITNMARARPSSTKLDLEGGLETVHLIRTQHSDVPVIIYSGSYGAAHHGETPTPVVLTTNITSEVFNKVVDIATDNGRHLSNAH